MPTVLAASCTSDTHRKSNTYNRRATAGSRDSSTKNINKLTRAAVQVQVASAHRREKYDKASNQQTKQQYVREVVIVTITTHTHTRKQRYMCVYIYIHTRVAMLLTFAILFMRLLFPIITDTIATSPSST